jgi:hypothetical protein
MSQEMNQWTLEHCRLGQLLCSTVFSYYPQTNRPSIEFLLVQKSFGKIVLVTNIDLGIGYEKQP